MSMREFIYIFLSWVAIFFLMFSLAYVFSERECTERVECGKISHCVSYAPSRFDMWFSNE